LPEANLGLLPGAGGTQRLPRTIGTPAALMHILMGDALTPREAERKGLVHETVSGKALDRAMEVARRLSSYTPESVACIKRLRHAFRVTREHAIGPTRSRGGSTSRRRRYGTPPTSGRPRPRRSKSFLGANDFDGDTAERYGCVNRALPDAELDGFVDVLARRIASFDRRAIAAAKNLINQVSLPSADRLLDLLNSFQTALTWSEAQQRIQALLERGLQRDGDCENRWPALLGTLLDQT